MKFKSLITTEVELILEMDSSPLNEYISKLSFKLGFSQEDLKVLINGKEVTKEEKEKMP